MEVDKKYANDLNEFYARFNCHNFESEINDGFNFLSEKKKKRREEEAEKNTINRQRGIS